MHRAIQSKVGIGALLCAVFLVLAPLPFLSSASADSSVYSDLPYTVLRLGQSFAQPKLVERVGGTIPDGAKAFQVDGVPFVVEIASGVRWDEFEAIVDSVARPEVKNKHPSGKRLTFVGWEPDFLPLRIEYRYILLVALALLTCGAYLLFTRTENRA